MNTTPKRPWLVCADCGLPYSDDGWADFVVSNETWAKLTAEDGADVLCACCMVRRAVRFGVQDPTGRFASGPFVSPQLRAEAAENKLKKMEELADWLADKIIEAHAKARAAGLLEDTK